MGELYFQIASWYHCLSSHDLGLPDGVTFSCYISVGSIYAVLKVSGDYGQTSDANIQSDLYFYSDNTSET